MKINRWFGLGFFLFAVGCTKAPKTELEKYSYAIGVETAQNLQKNSIPIDSKMMQLGIADKLSGKQVQLSPEELQLALRHLALAVEKSRVEESQSNLKKAQEILDSYQKNPEYKTSDSGLIYKIIKPGDGLMAKDTSFVSVRHSGRFADGKIFESSQGEPAELPLKSLIPGWVEALKMIKVGGEMEIVVPPALGYGALSNQTIPGNSVLIFNLELLKVRNK